MIRAQFIRPVALGRCAVRSAVLASAAAAGLAATDVSAQPASNLSMSCPGTARKPVVLLPDGATSKAQVFHEGAWRDLSITGDGDDKTWVFRSPARASVTYTLSFTGMQATLEGPGEPLVCSITVPIAAILGPKGGQAAAASLSAAPASPASAAPAPWRASEQQLIEGRRRLQQMDYAGARSRFEAAWATLETNHGWSAEWGSRVLWDLGYTIALTCRDYRLAYDKLAMAFSLAVTGTPADLGRQMRIRRDQARVAYQGGMWRVAADDYAAIRPFLEPILRQRSPLLVAEFDEEFAVALRRAGDDLQAREAAARAAQIRATTPANPLMQQSGPTLQQICGEPG